MNRALRDAEPLDLTPQLLDLLLHLLDHAGTLVTKEQLLDALWPEANVTENALTQAVSELRDALGDDAGSPQFIKTIARRGYRFIAPVEAVESPLSASVQPTHTVSISVADAIAVMDFAFLAATMGSVVGERITRVIEFGTAKKSAVIIVAASGGARMYEGMLSLMQMAKTSGALARHAEQRLPYLSILTNPTTAGVMASFGSLGDIIIAEPRSMIGFAGPRVIKETTHQDLPQRFQTAEFLEEHGLIDIIVHRKKMRDQICQLLGYFCRRDNSCCCASGGRTDRRLRTVSHLSRWECDFDPSPRK